MPDTNSTGRFLKSTQAKVLTVILLLQAALFYGVSRGENIPANKPLNTLPTRFGAWTMAQEGVIEKEVLEILKADDTVTRYYINPQMRAAANLYIAYFRTQRTGQAPHSPKNCLPGSGWVPSQAGTLRIQIPGEPEPIEVNHYVVAKGDEKSVVLYWYQTPHRVVASEYMAKIYLVGDALRYNRTDTALVRVVVPVFQNDERSAGKAASDFVQSSFEAIRAFLPS